ncbi:MAG: M23 family metallopeptidase, partial [Nitrospirales bacterium]
WSDQGLGVIVVLSNGFQPDGAIPESSQYENFAQRCANFVSASLGASIWVIGNEMNYWVERPGASTSWNSSETLPPLASSFEYRKYPLLARRQQTPIVPRTEASGQFISYHRSGNDPSYRTSVGAGEVITPERYAKAFSLCRQAIHSVPGHEDDEVLVGAVAPWNNQTTYPGNENGDWAQYLHDILTLLGPTGTDGFTIHTYTHAADPNQVFDEVKMGAPFQDRHYNFRAYQDFMNAVPEDMRHLAAYITETNQDVAWENRNTGWVQQAYAEINAWNTQPGNQTIRSLILYRWPNVSGDRWGIDGKQGVIEDFREAVRNNYRWIENSLTPSDSARESPVSVDSSASFEPGAQVCTLSIINLRTTPGYSGKSTTDVVAELSPLMELSLVQGPLRVDDLNWWKVSVVIAAHNVQGWVPRSDPAGTPLLGSEGLCSPTLSKPINPSESFEPGVQVCNHFEANLRTTPGYIGKSTDDVVDTIPALTEISLIQGPRSVDDLDWWEVSAGTSAQSIQGWMPVSTPVGIRILMPNDFCSLTLSKPYAGDFPIAQYFGENPDFYSNFTYDGVPLKGSPGMDIGAPTGTTVLATDDGVVIRVDFEEGGAGNFVLIQHQWGESVYTQLDEVTTIVGQTIKRGDLIAMSGNTGGSTGPHLGFRIRIYPYSRTDGWGGFSDPVPFSPWAQAQ